VPLFRASVSCCLKTVEKNVVGAGVGNGAGVGRGVGGSEGGFPGQQKGSDESWHKHSPGWDPKTGPGGAGAGGKPKPLECSNGSRT
jgi:hypothetical protein